MKAGGITPRPIIRFLFEILPPVMGRAAIAMAAVRVGAKASPGSINGQAKVRPPTDAMVITSLPRDRG
jgi:hypothetical protein